MGTFDSIGSAQVNAGGVYFLPGQYIVEVKKCVQKKSRKNKDLLIVEFNILESDVELRPGGSSASWVLNLDQDASMGNIKGFLAAANDIDPSNEKLVKDEITTAVAEYAFSEDNPLAGKKLGLTCTNVQTKANKDFTLHRFEPLPADE